MASPFFSVRAFLSWWLEAVDQHSLHSPFFFDFYTRVVRGTSLPENHSNLESLRRRLLDDTTRIPVKDLGTGGHYPASRSIAEIAHKTLSDPAFCALYFRLATTYTSSRIIELGTSLGITSLYLASAPNTHVVTFEGAPAVADIAEQNFMLAQTHNIQLVRGDIAHTLPAHLQTLRKIDLVFMDANHRYAPTVQYFEWILQKMHDKSILIADDIHHSEEMEKAWEFIKNHPLVHATADLFRCGIAFFDPSLNKQHVILQV